jgi:uncharacterized protein YbcI
MSAATQSLAPSSTVVALVREPRSEICNRMVRLHKQAFGRGPTSCRLLFPDPHSLMVLLEETLTVSERNLVTMGEIERLSDARIFVQSKLEPQARAIVEDALQRRTRAFITGMDPLRDIAMYFFTLEPMDTTEDGTAAGAGSPGERTDDSDPGRMHGPQRPPLAEPRPVEQPPRGS